LHYENPQSMHLEALVSIMPRFI